MSFKIETDVSIHNIPKYPFGQMKPGDSFLLNGVKPHTVSNAASSFSRSYNRGWKFSVRKTPEGHRCWRIS